MLKRAMQRLSGVKPAKALSDDEHSYRDIIRVTLDTARLTQPQADRLRFAYTYYDRRMTQMADWIFASKETSNFTYDITDLARAAFVGAISTATGTALREVAAYIDEVYADEELSTAVVKRAGSKSGIDTHDRTCLFGRRLGWYATVRALKPEVVIETGVDFGLGSILLAAALKRNTAEGHPGRHWGTDINPKAGFLVHGPWAEYSTMLYGDSIESLKAFNEPVDLFINDSDHSAEYEMREYQLLPTMLSKTGIVLGDNSHVTDALYRWSMETGRQFIFCPEFPKNHWYPGAGIGFSFPTRG